MATLATLVARGVLIRIDAPLDPGELPMRLFYGRLPRFVEWLEKELPTEPSDRGGRQSPDEQFDDLLHRFVSGEPLQDGLDLHPLTPLNHCVWELKTIDVRIFGWFPARDVFIAVNGAMKWKLRSTGYGGYRNEARTFMDRLDLDEPKCLHGGEARDVISV